MVSLSDRIEQNLRQLQEDLDVHRKTKQVTSETVTNCRESEVLKEKKSTIYSATQVQMAFIFMAMEIISISLIMI